MNSLRRLGFELLTTSFVVSLTMLRQLEDELIPGEVFVVQSVQLAACGGTVGIGKSPSQCT